MTPRALLFGFNCYLAAMAALFIAFSFDLPNPSWAVVTVFIVSRPAIGGAVWATGVYRLTGSLLGMGAALLIIPNMVDAPELMMFALAAWVGLCVYLSLLDRTPRSYAFVLAGYTATLVALPMVTDPGNLFNLAIARMEEILIGVTCAALVHNLVLPRSSEAVFKAKLNGTMNDARNWILGALQELSADAERSARRRLAADVTELTLLGSNLRFEPLRLRTGLRMIRALEERLVALLPLLTGVEDRALALARGAALDPRLAQLLADVRAWVEEGDTSDSAHIEKLLQACASAVQTAGPASSWPDLLAISLTQRLAQLISAWRDCVELSALIHNPHQLPSARLTPFLINRGPRTLHVDHGLALWSALAAGFAVLFCAGVSMALEWAPGIVSIGIASVFCSLFAGMDDPTPIQHRLMLWTLVSIPIGAVYVFAILPAVEGFGELALVMFPLFVAIGAYMMIPRHMVRALALALVVNTLIGLQPAYRADFTSFINLVLASLFGAISGLMVTKLARVIRADVSARRILRAGWNELANLASGATRVSMAQFATRMLDRLGLLAPRLAQAKTSPDLELANALRDLQIGFNLMELIDVAAALPAADQRRLLNLRVQLATYFRTLSRRPVSASATSIFPALEALLAALLNLDPSQRRERAIAAAVGLKQNLLAAGQNFSIEEAAT